MDSYCYALTIQSMMALLDLPLSEMPRLRQFAYDFASIVQEDVLPMPEEERLARYTLHADVRDWFREIVERRQADPGEDLISEMAQARDDAGKLMFSADRLVTHMTEFIFGGTDTAANTMATAVILLDEHPDQREEALERPQLKANAVEEALRLGGPVIGSWKQTTRDVEVGGYTIPANSFVWLLDASAGRDPSRFEDPESFDLHRPNSDDHLSFGKGRHFCLGAPLARLEAAIGLRVLYERMPDLRVVPGTILEYQETAIVRCLERLPVVWGAKAVAV